MPDRRPEARGARGALLAGRLRGVGTRLERDRLARALRYKALSGEPGRSTATLVAAGEGWKLYDVLCTAGPRDPIFEEKLSMATISLVLEGSFTSRSDRGTALLSEGALLLGNPGQCVESSHRHGEGARGLSFCFEKDLFDRLCHDAGALRPGFAAQRLPPLRELAALTARIRTVDIGRDSIEELALELAGAVLRIAGVEGREPRTPPPKDRVRIWRLVRQLEADSEERHSLAALARGAGLSRYHFLRTFKSVTGVTPHQWLLRLRLRRAAERLVVSRDPVTQIALGVGFEDLSHFIRSFRAEFGISPSRYRDAR